MGSFLIILIFIFALIMLVRSVIDYRKEVSNTRKIIESIPFLAIIISLFTNNDNNDATS